MVAFEAFVDRQLAVEAVEEALAGAASPGRLEVVGRRPLVVLDGAHNPAAAEALARAVREAFAFDRLRLVIAVSANKDAAGIVRELAPLADHAYAAANSSARSAPADAVEAVLAAADVETSVHGSVEEALGAALADAAEGDLVLVTGSLYTVADAHRAIMSEDP